nr:hypothetical protein [Kofleriaceae bacterium]
MLAGLALAACHATVAPPPAATPAAPFVADFGPIPGPPPGCRAESGQPESVDPPIDPLLDVSLDWTFFAADRAERAWFREVDAMHRDHALDVDGAIIVERWVCPPAPPPTTP